MSQPDHSHSAFTLDCVECLPKRRLCFTDFETSDLDPENCVVLEAGCIITDIELNEIAIFHEVERSVMLPYALARMDDYVKKMHTESGLIEEVKKNIGAIRGEGVLGSPMTTGGRGWESLYQFVKQNVPDPNQGILAGSSVGFDKNIIRAHCKPVLDHLFYRVLDVSAIKEAARMWAPAQMKPKAERIDHRVLGDLRASIEEARRYKEKIFESAELFHGINR